MTGLPNLIGDPAGEESVDNWFNKAAFQAVPSGTFGNEPRNSLRGPNYRSFDLTLSRRFGFGDRVGATVRWDIFNVFNRTNFGLPNRDLASAGPLGTITSLGGDARIMQLSARLTF